MCSDIDINFVVSAPGKVILFGEHSVVYKKAAVSTAISERLFVTLSSVKENKFVLKLPQIGSELAFHYEQLSKVIIDNFPLQSSYEIFGLDKPDIINHEVYIETLKKNLQCLGVNLTNLPEKTVAALLGFLYVFKGVCQSLKVDLVPFSLKVKSELEIGAGTGSSAAFAVAISASVFHYRKCLERHNNLSITVPKVHDNVVVNATNNYSGFSIDELRIINKWAFCLERIMHGRPSGIDNTTCTFGSVVVTSQGSNEEELTFHCLENVPKISILLISTGVSRNTAHLVAKVRRLREDNCAAVDAIFNAMDVIAKEAFKTLHSLSDLSCDSAKTGELYKTLGELMELNHGLLKTLGVSHESLEHIINVSSRHSLASKLTGAGGGGYAITLIPPNFSKEKLENLKRGLGPEYKVKEINIAEQGIRLEKEV